MKTITIFLFLVVSLVINAQTTYVPNDNFEQYLINQGYDDVMDDYVLTSKINTITVLDLRQKGILDLTGINDFVALKELNISNNLVYNMGSLAVVDISGLINLEKLDASYNDIAVIDLTYNEKIIDLNLSNNKLTKLRVLALSELEFLNASENQIQAIDLTLNTKLRRADVSSNLITATLDLSQQYKIEELNASVNSIDNLPLNAGAKTSLYELNLEHNKLKTIDLTGFTALFKAFLGYNELTTVVLGGNTTLYRFTVNNNKLTSLDFNVQRGGLNIDELNCSNNELTSLTVSSSIGLIDNFACNNNKLSYFVVDGYNINKLDISNNPGVQLTYANSESINELYINNNSLTSLGINPFTLTSLWCRNNNLTTLTGIDDLHILDCSYNQISTLDISVDSKLSELYCNSNNLTSIAVLPKNITTLNCRNNAITTLNLDNVNAWYFESLLCDSNKIETLDLERFTALGNIYCSHNNLVNLNLRIKPTQTQYIICFAMIIN